MTIQSDGLIFNFVFNFDFSEIVHIQRFCNCRRSRCLLGRSALKAAMEDTPGPAWAGVQRVWETEETLLKARHLKTNRHAAPRTFEKASEEKPLNTKSKKAQGLSLSFALCRQLRQCGGRWRSLLPWPLASKLPHCYPASLPPRAGCCCKADEGAGRAGGC